MRALARSDAAAAKVEALGAEAVRGDLGDRASLAAGAAGCATAFHLAAHLGEWGPWEDFERGNVEGTRNALAGCEEAGVRRFVHCGTEAALMAGEPLVHVDETAPLRPDSPAPYPATKARAEQAVRDANREGFETVVVAAALRLGQGRHDAAAGDGRRRSRRANSPGSAAAATSPTPPTSTTSSRACVLAAEKGRPGEAYFVTDGEPVVFREFVTAMLADPGRRATRPQPAGLDGGADGAGLRSGLEAPAAARRAADDPLPLLDPDPGMHDRDRQGPRASSATRRWSATSRGWRR